MGWTAAVAVGVVVGRTAVMGTVVTAGAAWLADGATLGVSDAELLLQARASAAAARIANSRACRFISWCERGTPVAGAPLWFGD